jgi:hypothetical protein
VEAGDGKAGGADHAPPHVQPARMVARGLSLNGSRDQSARYSYRPG